MLAIFVLSMRLKNNHTIIRHFITDKINVNVFPSYISYIKTNIP